jgi:two-component system, NarL family, sensor histidine kinase UhpB
VERDLDPRADELAPDEQLVVYRVAQEALTNAIRHGGGRRAWLTLRPMDRTLQLELRDDGRGFDVGAAADGAGLRGMRERAVLIGAMLAVESSPGAGTTVRLTLAPGSQPA